MPEIILILTITIIAIILVIVDSFEKTDFTPFHGLTGFSIITIIVLSISLLVGGKVTDDSKPDAIDVYNGNTVLEITYRDGIPVDTVVVFK